MKPHVPAGALVHPAAIGALCLLVMNDHWWKDQFHSVWTGKLSDVAGLILFPLLLQGLWEGAAYCTRNPWRPSRAVLIGAIGATGLVFSLVQLTPWTGQAYVYFSTVTQAIGWSFLGFDAIPAHLTPDVTDLLTLPALLVPLWIHQRRIAS